MLKIGFVSWGFTLTTSGYITIIDGDVVLFLYKEEEKEILKEKGLVPFKEGYYRLGAVTNLIISSTEG